MLVLSRRERQRIRLGNSIVVTVVRVSGDRVRLGIEAPQDVLVLRDELEVDQRRKRRSEITLAEPVAPGPHSSALAEPVAQVAHAIRPVGTGRASRTRNLARP
jgi:carbon storage regulator